MRIESDQRAYLVLSKLDADDRARLQANLDELATFPISEGAQVLFTELRGRDLGNALFPGVKEPGRVTVFRLNAELELFGPAMPISWPIEFLTVFDK